MPYTAIKPVNLRSNESLTTMANRGVNFRDAPQFLDIRQALSIINYAIEGTAKLRKRKGLTRLLRIVGNKKVTMIESFTDDIFILGYGNSITAWDLSDGSTTVINSSGDDKMFEGRRYGDYFFVADGVNKIARIKRTLAYDAQTANFTAGQKLTGSTSGATAIILEDSDSGATGTLTLGSVTGTFQDNELITTSGGSATANGTPGWNYSTISDAPIATTLEVTGTRLTSNILEEPTATAYSEVDDGTNPPFSTWTIGTNANDPGKVYNRTTGTVESIRYLGNIIVVLAENGKWAYTIDTLDSGGTLKKIDTPVMSRVDFGGSRAAEVTNKGLVYANEKGLWQIGSLGQSNVPFSTQETNLTEALGESYFADIDLTNADLTYDAEKEEVYLTCAKDSDINNLVIVYNFTFKAIWLITGWTVNRFLSVNSKIYGASAKSDTIVWECFRGNSDDGSNISTEYIQELASGLETRQEFQGFYVHGFLSDSSSIPICYDIYNAQGVFEEDRLCYTFTPQWISGGGDGWGVVGWGDSAFGGGSDTEGLVESFDGAGGKIRNYQRLHLRISESSQVPHQITWLKMLFRVKTRIRRRKLTLTT